MVLIYVVVMADIEARRQQIGILRSLGFTRKNVTAIFTMEGTALSLAGSAIGLAAGVTFAGLGVWASNNLWTQFLPVSSDLYMPGPLLVLASFLAGFILSTLAFAVGARASARGDVVSNIRGLPDTGPGIILANKRSPRSGRAAPLRVAGRPYGRRPHALLRFPSLPASASSFRPRPGTCSFCITSWWETSYCFSPDI